MWQICACIPQSLKESEELAELATKLTSAFFLETYIHAKDRVCIFVFRINFDYILLNCAFVVYFIGMDRIINKTVYCFAIWF